MKRVGNKDRCTSEGNMGKNASVKKGGGELKPRKMYAAKKETRARPREGCLLREGVRGGSYTAQEPEETRVREGLERGKGESATRRRLETRPGIATVKRRQRAIGEPKKIESGKQKSAPENTSSTKGEISASVVGQRRRPGVEEENTYLGSQASDTEKVLRRRQ